MSETPPPPSDAVPHPEGAAGPAGPPPPLSDGVPHPPSGDGSWWAEPAAAAAPGPAPARSPRRTGALLAAGAVVLGLLGGGVAYAATRDDAPAEAVATDGASTDGAATGQGPTGAMTERSPGGRGTIAAIDGTTLTVETDDGTTTTVTTSDDTIVADTADGELADIEIGDQVMVVGEEADGEVTADRLVDMSDVPGPGGVMAGGPQGAERPEGAPEGAPDGAPPAEGMTPPDDGAVVRGGPGGGTAGEVTAVDGDTLTVTTLDGEEITVITTDDTVVTVSTEIEVADLEVGDVITFGGSTDGDQDDIVSAVSIRRGDLVMGGPGGMPEPR